MKYFKKLYLLLVFPVVLTATGAAEDPAIISDIDYNNQARVITGVLATGYYCVYNSELAGSQTVGITISNIPFALKASFLFGGRGVAMQGTGRTAPDGDYIKYTGGAASFVRLSGPDAGRNLDGRYVVNPQILRDRYAALGITDFTGFGNLALLHPDRATFSVVSSITGSSGQTLTPWSSVAVDPALIPLGQSFSISFTNRVAGVPPASDDSSRVAGVPPAFDDSAWPFNSTTPTFTANDTGGAIKGKHIDIYLGEGQSALDNWTLSGGNRYVNIYLP